MSSYLKGDDGELVAGDLVSTLTIIKECRLHCEHTETVEEEAEGHEIRNKKVNATL